MQTILVANPKGGSGKTTLATNVAGWLAGKRQRVALADIDPQRSATEWLAPAPALFPPIIGLSASDTTRRSRAPPSRSGWSSTRPRGCTARRCATRSTGST